MSRLNKYMVYNPKKSKPVKYYSKLDTAFEVASRIRDKEKEDVLVMQVIGIAQCDSPLKSIKRIINSGNCATYKLEKIKDLLKG